MQKVRFVLVSGFEIVDGKLPGLHGRQIFEACISPAVEGRNFDRLDFAGGVCQVIIPSSTFYLGVEADAVLRGERWREGRGLCFGTGLDLCVKLNMVPIAVSDDDGANWRMLPQHPEYVRIKG